MKRGIGLILSVLVIASIFVPGCGTSTTAPALNPAPELTEEYIKTLLPLCSETKIEEVDLTVLTDVDYIIRHYSVFTSPAFKDVFGDTIKDRAYLMRAARDALFCDFLSLPKDQIPQWAIDWVETEIIAWLAGIDCLTETHLGDKHYPAAPHQSRSY